MVKIIFLRGVRVFQIFNDDDGKKRERRRIKISGRKWVGSRRLKYSKVQNASF